MGTTVLKGQERKRGGLGGESERMLRCLEGMRTARKGMVRMQGRLAVAGMQEGEWHGEKSFLHVSASGVFFAVFLGPRSRETRLNI